MCRLLALSSCNFASLSFRAGNLTLSPYFVHHEDHEEHEGFGYL